jgi:N-6 DNA Methylase
MPPCPSRTELHRVLQSIRSLVDVPRLVTSLGHEALFEAVPDEVWNTARQRLLRVVAVGRSDGLPWFAIETSFPEQDSLRLARRIRGRGKSAIVVALESSTRQLAITAAFNQLPHLTLDLADPAPELLASIARLAGASGAGPMGFAARAADALSTESVGRRFFNAFRASVDQIGRELPCRLQSSDRHSFVLLQLTRVLFLYFIQSKGWLAGRDRFLAEEIDRCVSRGRRIHRDLLRPLFFGTLNCPRDQRSRLALGFGAIPFLNGGLFEPHPLERQCKADIPNVLWCTAFDNVFERFHFTVSENTLGQSVAPDMLGRVFEGVMAPEARRASGTFYTPAYLVQRILDSALIAFLAIRLKCSESTAQQRLEDPDVAAQRLLAKITLLDPAAGSGAFLLCALERLARAATSQRTRWGGAKRRVLRHNLFGVDLNAAAVRLAELRLWLAVIADEPADHPDQVSPLPNLDCLIRQGDSLDPIGLDSSDSSRVPETAAARQLARLRHRVITASGRMKRALECQLRTAEAQMFEGSLLQAKARHHAAIAECLTQARATDLFGKPRGLNSELGLELRRLRAGLKRIRRAQKCLSQEREVPWFHYHTHFADVFAQGGFQIVLGNPPWLRSEAIAVERRRELTGRYRWWRGIRGTYGKSPDLAVAFLERALELVQSNGVVAMLVPSKIATAAYGATARHALASTATLHALADLSRVEAGAFDATVYPLAIVAGKENPPPHHLVRTSLDLASEGRVLQSELRGGGPWVLVDRGLHKLVASMEADHPRLREAISCHLGLKTGLDEVFLRPPEWIEPELLRWAVRGRDLRPFAWKRNVRLLWTHTCSGYAIPRLPAGAMRYLSPHEKALRARKDYRDGPWWAMFRTRPACAPYRIVWSDLSRQLTAVALTTESDQQDIPLNSCYVAPTASSGRAQGIAAWLNSSWIRAVARLSAPPASGGFARFNAATVGGVPLAVSALDDARLPELTRAGRSGEEVQATLDALVADHLGLSQSAQRKLRASLGPRPDHHR